MECAAAEADPHSSERGNMDAEFYEITEDDANRIVGQIRRL